jgi:hypothetical protein
MINNPSGEPPERQLTPLLTGSPRSDGDRLATRPQDGTAAAGGLERTPAEMNDEKEEKVTWASLPHRRQLVILTLARLSEPLVQTSLQVCVLFPFELGH